MLYIYLNYILFNLCTNPNEMDTVIIPTYGWGWEVKNHSQKIEKLAGSGARSRALPRSKTWTQENQLGDYDNTLCGMMWLEDPTIGWLIVCPALNPTTAHILFYYIFCLTDRFQSQFIHKSWQVPISTFWWILCIWKPFLWCHCFCNRHPLDLRKGEKTNKM